MATIKVKFRASSVPGKEGTLYYHLIHQRNLRWISTDYHVFPEEWNDKKSAIIVSNRNNRQAHLQLIQSQIDWEMKQMQRIIHDKEMDGIPYTIDDIAKEIQQLPPNKSVFTFFRQQIAKKEQMQCIGTKSNYVSAANRFMEFRNHEDLTFSQMTSEMMKIINHERQQQMIMDTYGYQIVEDEKGQKGIKDKDGKMILECQYKKIEVTNDGFAYCYIRKKVGRKEWIDLRNRLWFANKPQSVKLMGIDFSTEDGKKLYPRILSKYIDEKTYLTVKTLELQVGTGLSWKHRFIPWHEPNKVYLYKEGEGNTRLYIDEDEQYYVQKNIGSQLEKVDSREALAEFAQRDKEERKESFEKLKNSYKHYEYYPVDDLYPIKKHLGTAKDKITIEKDGIWHVEDAQVNESYWVDPVTYRKHYTRPVLFKRGYLNILKEGDWCYVRNIPGLKNRPLRQWEIVADDNLCVINNKYLIEKSEPDQWYKICRRTDDFTYFSVLACFYESEYIKDDTEIQITQFDGEGLKMTQEGFTYTPLVIKTHKRSRWL